MLGWEIPWPFHLLPILACLWSVATARGGAGGMHRKERLKKQVSRELEAGGGKKEQGELLSPIFTAEVGESGQNRISVNFSSREHRGRK